MGGGISRSVLREEVYTYENRGRVGSESCIGSESYSEDVCGDWVGLGYVVC